jgi:hypothetical protein
MLGQRLLPQLELNNVHRKQLKCPPGEIPVRAIENEEIIRMGYTYLLKFLL